MKYALLIVSFVSASALFSQDYFDLIVKSGCFDTITTCKGTIYFETTSLVDSTHSNTIAKFTEKSAGELSLLEYTDSCAAFFKIESDSINAKKTKVRLIRYKHLKTSDASSRCLISYRIDFTLKCKNRDRQLQRKPNVYPD